MRQIYINAIKINQRRIDQCVRAMRDVSDQYDFKYWNLELVKAINKEKRIKTKQEAICHY